MTDTPAPGPEEQPDPGTNDLKPRELYQRSMQRLKALHERRAFTNGGNVDSVKLEANAAMRAAELNAIANLLVEKGLFTLDEFYAAIAVSAATAGNKLFAEMSSPRLLDINGHKVNGS
jgi:hypothetical protein